jgi:hypothetical protein
MEVMSTRSWSLTTEESVLGAYSRGGLVGLERVWTLCSRENVLPFPAGEKNKIFLESLNGDF